MSDDEAGSGRLSGIGDALDEGSTADTESDQTAAETASETSADSALDPSTDVDTGPPGPAFPYEATAQTPIYPREETKADLDGLELDVRQQLLEHDVSELPKRELHDAILRAAIDEPERIAERILDERGLDR